MLDCHDQTIKKILTKYKSESYVKAIILTGDAAKADNFDACELELLYITDNQNYLELKANNKLYTDDSDCLVSPTPAAYGTVISEDFIREIESKGSEPTRSVFKDTLVVYSEIEDLEDVISNLCQYPVSIQSERMMSFKSQIVIHMANLEFAEYSGNTLLLYDSAAKIVHFAYRLILSDNKLLYPSKKQLVTIVKTVRKKPDFVIQHAEHFLQNPSIKNSEAFMQLLFSYKKYPNPPEGYVIRYKNDSENRFGEMSGDVGEW